MILSAPPLFAADRDSSELDFADGLYARQMYTPAVSEYEKFILAHPGSPEIPTARYRAADSYYFLKDYQKAVVYFGAFIKDFPGDKRGPMALFRIASAKFYLGKLPEANRIFWKLLKKEPDPALRSGALFYLGRIYDARGKGGESLKAYQRLMKEYPQSEFAAYASLAIGDTYFNAKDTDKAVETYKLAAQKSEPAEIAAEARWKLAEIYFSRKDFTNAAAYYQKLFSDAKSPPTFKEKALLGLFYCDYETKDLGRARKRFEAAQEAIGQGRYEPDIRYLLALLLFDDKNYGLASEHLDAVLASPKKSPALEEKAMLKKSEVLSLLGQKESAVAELQKLLDRKASNADRAYFEKAQILEVLGRDAEALADYEALLAQYPESQISKAGLYETGHLHLKMKNPPAAKETFERFVKKYDHDEAAQAAILEIIQIDLDAGRFEEASKRASDFIQEYPSSSFMDIAAYKRGTAMAGLGKFKEAADDFKKVAGAGRASPLYAESLYGTAVSLEKAGLLADAASFYERITGELPDHPLSKEVLAHLGPVYIEMAWLEKAGALYEDILLNKPEVNMDPDAAFWIVQYFLDTTQYEKMQKILAALPGRFPDKDFSHEVNFFMGESAMGLKDARKALEYYTKSLAANLNGDYAAHAYLGSGVASVVAGDFLSAEKNFNEALRFENELKVAARARFEIAGIRLTQGDVPEAAKAFMLVAIFYDDPKYSPWALYKAAECFAKTNQLDEAEKAVTELKERYPNSEWAKKAEGLGLSAESKK